MFYDDFCKTELQQAVFQEIIKLSKGGNFIAIQELDHLPFARAEIAETLAYFEDKGLFSTVQHCGESFPVFFSLKM